MGISSGGTITGVSQRVRENYPKAKIVAVDVEGSIIFGGKSHKRFIPGIGSSMKPEILKRAVIDDVVSVNEDETINACRELLERHNLYAGGSSGSVYAGIKKYFRTNNINSQVNIMCVFADSGERYITTIYNDKWGEMVREFNLSRQYSEPLAI